MDEDEEMAELRAQEAKRVRDEAKKCLRHASFQLGKAAYEIDEYLKDFSTARIPIRRQVILNEAIGQDSADDNIDLQNRKNIEKFNAF